MTEKAKGRGASARGLLRTVSMARFKYFLPMKPLGHKVSEINSMGTTKGDASVDAWRIARRVNAVDGRERRDNIPVGNTRSGVK